MYISDNSIYIRREKINNEDVFYFFVGKDEKLYQLNEAAYDCYIALEMGSDEKTIASTLQSKYSKTPLEDIVSLVKETIQLLLDANIIEKK